jgi:hypothetical protein
MDEPRELEHLLRRQDVAVRDVEGIAGLPHMQPGERAPRAADRIEAASGAGPQRPDVAQGLPDDFLRLLDGFCRNVLQREAAERQRDAGLHLAAMHVDQFQRPAAEIADDAVGPMDAGNDAEGGELGFALAGQHVDPGAADAPGLGNEGRTVCRVAARRGGDDPQPLDVHRVAQGTKSDQRRERLVDCLLGEQPGRLHFAAEAAQRLLVEQRRRAPREPLVDDETDRIGTDVDDRNGQPESQPPLGRFAVPRLKRARGGA